METQKENIIINSSDEMKIKIQTFDNIYPITIKRSSKVSELKEKIEQLLNIPVIKQRLIFQGKLLQPNDNLSAYKITDDNVIHLVAKTLEDQEQPSNNQQSNQSNPLQNNPDSRGNLDELFNGIIEIPILRSNRRSRRRRVPHFDISESFESMHQNLLSLKNIQICQNKFDNEHISKNMVINGFDLSKNKYEIGQWVDVKDTIDQWLEAQITQIRGSLAYVHYNGWGNRWDEWIEFSSPRIAPFKTYTVQSPNSIFLSPYPTVVPDANVESQKRNIDTFYYMEKSVEFMAEVTKCIELMSKLRISKSRYIYDNQKSEEENNKIRKEEEIKVCKQIENQNCQLDQIDNELLFTCSQIIPLMDRTGRLVSDISLHLSHLLLNSNLYPQFFLGYMINNIMPGNERNINSSVNLNVNPISNNNLSGQGYLNPIINTLNQSNISTNNNPNTNPLNINSFPNFNAILQNLQQSSHNAITINQSILPNLQTNQQNTQININQNNISNLQANSTMNIMMNLPNSININPITNRSNQSNFVLNNLNASNPRQLNNNNTEITNPTETVSNSNQAKIVKDDKIITEKENTDLCKDKDEINKEKNMIEEESKIEEVVQNKKNENTSDIEINKINDEIKLKNYKKSIDDEELSKQKNNLKKFKEALPKINLQIPAMLSPGDVSQMGNFGNTESNIDIYVHTFVAPANRNSSPGQVSNNSSNQQNAENTNISPESLINNILNTQNPNTNNNPTIQQYASILENMSTILAHSRRNDTSSQSSTSVNNIPNSINNANVSSSQDGGNLFVQLESSTQNLENGQISILPSNTDQNSPNENFNNSSPQNEVKTEIEITETPKINKDPNDNHLDEDKK